MAPGEPPSAGLILVIGEALVDIVIAPDGPLGEHVGGSPANVALGLARLGHAVELATHIGTDRRGLEVRAHLEGDGVRLRDGSTSAPRTPTATATLDERGGASYDFDLTWDLPDDLDPGAATHLHVGSIATWLQPGATTLRRVAVTARGQATLSYDPNLRPALLGSALDERTGVEELVAISDVVKASEDDLAWLYPGLAVEQVMRQWAATGPALVVVTLGAAGARALVGGELVSVPPQVVDVVDTVGAGDSFMAALISGLLDAGLLGDPAGRSALAVARAEAVLPALIRAIRVAAITCSRAGADPPYRDEL